MFRKFSQKSAQAVGSKWAFVLALLSIVIWVLLGPRYHHSDTWQLIINTATTIVTFLMVFLIQNTQNRDATAMHLKLDELIRALHGARNSMVDLENMTDEEIQRIQKEFHHICETRRSRQEKGHLNREVGDDALQRKLQDSEQGSSESSGD
ncbi:MAG TPA: low affinity iron permease family protein [Tepidisphaeraceae bacterium]|jgi:low affinity Fe/Cu permease